MYGCVSVDVYVGMCVCRCVCVRVGHVINHAKTT